MICVNSVTVSPKNITLKVGDWYYNAKATVSPANAECKSVTWHSANSSIASVNASSGYICANAVGTTKIYATATDGSGCRDYITVTVSNTIPVTSVTLNNTRLCIEEGQSADLYAAVWPANATNQNLNWTSSDNGVATVSNGTVTAISVGTATITATATDGSGKSASCTVAVTQDVLVCCIIVMPSTQKMLVDDSAYLRVGVFPDNATNKSIVWTSDNEEVATVNPISGLIYAQGEGTTTIRATAQDGSGVSDSCEVTVSSTLVTVEPSSKNMLLGDTAYLSATVCPVNDTNQCVVWCSDNEEVATVDPISGYVSAKSVGYAKIYASTTDGSDASGYCSIKVRAPVPVESVSINAERQTLIVGETEQLSVDISPVTATNKTVTWSSSDPDIVAVDPSTGVITAKGAGSAIIKASHGIDIFDSCIVTVSVVPVISIEIPEEKYMVIDELSKIDVHIKPLNATNKTILWYSTNPNVATVDTNGVVYAHASGVTSITAQSAEDQSISCTCSIKVLEQNNVEQANKVIQDNVQFICEAANSFGLQPSDVAMVIYAEQCINVDWKDQIIDPLLSSLSWDVSLGIGQIRISTAKRIEDNGYMPITEYNTSPGVYGDVPTLEQCIGLKLLNPQTNAQYVAAYLALIIDLWKDQYPSIHLNSAVLATLYNIGEYGNEGPHSNPKSNGFGDFASGKRQFLKQLLVYN